MRDILINQSLIKDLFKYKKEELCGLVFNNKWIYKQFGGGSKANNLGHYFEYLCTGALAKGETIPPKPDLVKAGGLSAPFELARKQSVYYKEIIHKYGITDIKAGEKVIAEEQWIGTLDISARWDNVFLNEGSDNSQINKSIIKDPNNKENRVIIDLKYSGLLDDKWSDFGWDTEWLPKKEGTMLQATHYTFLYWKKYGYVPPFFFFVFDSSKVNRCKIIYIPITLDKLINHEKLVNGAKKYLDKQLEKGFKAIPKYEECLNCPYNKWCTEKQEVPPIITVEPN